MEKLSYEDLIVQNLLDPNINTLSRPMAQYLIESIYQGKNIFITGGSKSGRTLLLNILAKHINMKRNLFVMEAKKQLVFLEHNNHSVDLSTVKSDSKNKDYFIISKGFPYYDEYQSFVLDDVPKNSYVNINRLLLANKQVLSVFNEASNMEVINKILRHTVDVYKAPEKTQQLGISLMEKVDILIHIRQYQDDYIRIKEISEPSGYDPNKNLILLDTVYEYITNGNKNNDGKLIGDFIKR